jgi:protein SCO1/2
MHGVTMDEALAAPALRLADADGKVFDLAAERGHTVVLFFGYAHCPDICPTTLADWARTKALLGAKGAGIRFVFVSVDPGRDSAAAVRKFVQQFDSSFVGLATTTAQLDTISRAWGFTVTRESMAGMTGIGGYGVSHPAQAFIVRRDGKVPMIFPPGLTPAEMASDLRQLR